MNSLLHVDEFLTRVADKSGFKRDRYVSANVPTDLEKIVVVYFWGDWKHHFLLSTVLIKNWINSKFGKYVIFCSYPGFQSLYPNVDEFWSLGSGSQSLDSNVFFNYGVSSPPLISCENHLMRFFPGEVIDGGKLVEAYFDRGFTSKFFEDYASIQYSLPSISSPPFEIAKSFSRHIGKKIFIYPCKKARFIEKNKEHQAIIDAGIWNRLVDNLIKNGYLPVIYQNNMTFDLSPKYGSQCQYVSETNISTVLAVMRASDCVIDIFSGISKLAMIARVPYLIVDERRKYFMLKDDEIDDIFNSKVPHSCLFFHHDVKKGEFDFVDQLLMEKLKRFTEKSDRDTWQSSSACETFLPYISKQKNESIGLNFIEVPRL